MPPLPPRAAPPSLSPAGGWTRPPALFLPRQRTGDITQCGPPSRDITPGRQGTSAAAPVLVLTVSFQSTGLEDSPGEVENIFVAKRSLCLKYP